MRKLMWLFFGLVSAGLALLFLSSGFSAYGTAQNDPTLTASDADALGGAALGLLCCISLPFGAFSLYAFGMIGKIGREQRSEQREKAMLTEMQNLRAGLNPNDMQMKLASKFYREGKHDAAIAILEDLPYDERARAILAQIREKQKSN